MRSKSPMWQSSIPRRIAPLLVLLLWATSIAGCGTDEPLSSAGPVCSSSMSGALQPLDAPPGVYLDAPAEPGLDIVRNDLQRYLAEAWAAPSVAIESGAPPGDAKPAIWITTSAAARSELGTTIDKGYVLRRRGDTVIAYAPDATDLAYAAYALLEQLGFRFFHPKQELVPALGGPAMPRVLDVTRQPAARIRGIQPHTLHPIEYLAPLAEPGADNLADAKLLVDWLVKTGQNHLQWPLLQYDDFAAYASHANSIADYAHQRGVAVGAVVELFGGSALQNNYVLIADPANWQAELDAKLEELMTVRWDRVELALGEFVGNDPSQVITWMNHATQYMADHYPGVELSAEIHVGNYPGLWVTYNGQKTFFYHLAGYADPRLASSVHTVYFFDLYRDWATYKHDNFFLQKDYVFAQLPKRKVRYFPESAYWIGGDIDVPQFLPEYIYSRWLDIHSLTQDIADKGLPALDGHVTFSSGHEWGYWLTDYLVAHMLWNPSAPFEDSLKHFTSAFGPCASELEADLEKLVALQSEYLFDKRLVGYVSGENNTLDVGWLAGYESHPRRAAFKDVAAMDADAQATFEHDVVDQLDAMARAIAPLSRSVAARCKTADDALRPWCDEIGDGFEIDRLRAAHAVLLYRAVLDSARGGSAHARLLDDAASVRSQAADVVARREPHYRFDLSRYVDDYENRTIYPFGYLRTVHDLCFWRRQEQQARTLVETGYPAALQDLPTCQD